MQEIVTVTQLSAKIKQAIESGFGVLNVRGEVSGLKRHASGHIYFSLKDNDAVINAVCWRGTKCADKLSEGLDVVCTARLTTYQLRSNYQLIVTDVQPAGQGALLKMLKELKERLLKEGLFDPSKKKPLPYLPKVIGVITSPSGAVIRDICHRISDRFPVRVLLWPAAVQGDGAAEQVVNAIKGFNKIEINNGAVPRPDVIIVARGGGSFEDLMPFNDEAVVRAASASSIPLISAIGHETDNTLLDFAADVRAPTPTAAAEMSVPVKDDLTNVVMDFRNRLKSSLRRALKSSEETLQNTVKRLPASWQVVGFSVQKLDHMFDTVKSRVLSHYEQRKHSLIKALALFYARKPDIICFERNVHETYGKLSVICKDLLNSKIFYIERLSGLLDSFCYQKTLERGFAVISSADGKVVSTSDIAMSCNQIHITFKDGRISAVPVR
ncbi:MAG: exodeoxyribonuclease VII large subunit [Holosporales bacterium]|jgi:exodeoxyribonuclease VII large subunit|nr:exodeoxyribonuclease VII large subunit [Holosporales bacterium]